MNEATETVREEFDLFWRCPQCRVPKRRYVLFKSDMPWVDTKPKCCPTCGSQKLEDISARIVDTVRKVPGRFLGIFPITRTVVVESHLEIAGEGKETSQ